MEVIEDIFNALIPVITSQINVRLVIGIIAGAIGSAVGLVFLLWAVDKLSIIIMNAFRHGTLSDNAKSANTDEWHSYDLWEQDQLDFIRDLRESFQREGRIK